MELKNENLYYVGGVVRDDYLGINSLDTDYCYEGNAIDFAVASGLNIIKANNSLGTVKVNYQGREIDIASTRTEVYPRKGHLPRIKSIGCPLKEDLIRRDFTINAMAKRTTDGELIDYFGGLDDIREKKLRVLHKESFIDDPTRIVRGLKFSVRFGFELDDETRKLQEEYLSNVNYDMSNFRLRKEIMDAFSLNKTEVYTKFVKQGIYKLLGSEYKKNEDFSVDDLQKVIEEYPTKNTWLLYLLEFNLTRLELTRAEKRIIEWIERLKTQKPTNNTPVESIMMYKLKDKKWIYD